MNPQHLELLSAGAEALTRQAREGGGPLDFSRATLRGLRLEDAHFYPDSDFSGCTLIDCVITRCSLQGANFDDANLVGCQVTDGEFSNSSFRRASLEGA